MNIEEVKIELTNYCKRKCIHCSSDANTNYLIELKLSEVENLIDECAELGVSSIVLTGGEATEYQEIEEVVYYIKKKGIQNIKLYTMCEPTIEKFNLLKRLTELGLTEIIYSLTISLTTDGEVTYENIENFLKKVSQLNTLSFHYCLTSKTIKDLDKLEQILENLNSSNFKSLSFLRYVEHGRGKDDLTLSSDDLKKIKAKLISFMERYPQQIHLGSPFNILNITSVPCTAGSKTMIIGFDGNVYPCDAMKYFDYLGSGGNIFHQTLKEIYSSSYFKEIRNASSNRNEECESCSQEQCKGGCLAQKMLEIVKKEDIITTRWYQENALRTMNDFENENILKLNAYAGILGEYGEFCDYIKKLYTHNLNEEKRQEIMALAPDELGDIVWYLSTSLALYYHYTLDSVYEYLLNLRPNYYLCDANLIEKASFNKDPLCFFQEKKAGYKIDSIHSILNVEYKGWNIDEKEIFKLLLDFNKVLSKLNDIKTTKDAKRVVAEILLEVAKISKILFDKNLSDILNSNIEKLRKRYPEGFDKDIANIRIDATKNYKEEPDYTTPKKRILSITKKENSV